jgi:hypothetical protein
MFNVHEKGFAGSLINSVEYPWLDAAYSATD